MENERPCLLTGARRKVIFQNDTYEGRFAPKVLVLSRIGAYQVVNSDMDITGKLLFVLFAIVYAAVFVWSNYRFWKKWFRKDKFDE